MFSFRSHKKGQQLFSYQLILFTLELVKVVNKLFATNLTLKSTFRANIFRLLSKKHLRIKIKWVKSVFKRLLKTCLFFRFIFSFSGSKFKRLHSSFHALCRVYFSLCTGVLPTFYIILGSSYKRAFLRQDCSRLLCFARKRGEMRPLAVHALYGRDSIVQKLTNIHHRYH